MDKEQPLLRRTWAYAPGINGGVFSYMLHRAFSNSVTAMPHDIETQNLFLRSDDRKTTLASILPNFNTILLSATDDKDTQMALKDA